jgi:hypothetical protein
MYGYPPIVIDDWTVKDRHQRLLRRLVSEYAHGI